MEFDIGLVTKFTSTACAGLIMGLVIWDFFEMGKIHAHVSYVTQILNDINLFIVAAVLGLAEFGTKFVVEGFALIANLFGKGLFCVFLGTWVLGFHGAVKVDDLKGIQGYSLAVAIVLMVVGVMYIAFYFLFGGKQTGTTSLPAAGK